MCERKKSKNVLCCCIGMTILLLLAGFIVVKLSADKKNRKVIVEVEPAETPVNEAE